MRRLIEVISNPFVVGAIYGILGYWLHKMAGC